ncbi:hypothetical protein [Catenulispora sp. GP43]|uniref:hypothetical protein n=1 Tax=Catenulispora sp. GP43 TaxID=3156263 RepID=UPI003517A5B8
MTMGAMLDTAPPEAAQPEGPEPPGRPGEPGPRRAARSPRTGGPSRANALATLGFAVLALGSLAIPWAGYDDGSPSWSGFDIMGDPPPVADGIGAVVACLHVLQWLSVGLIVLSALRLIVPARGLAWLSLLAALALVLCAVLAAFRFHSELQGVDAFAPSMRAGPVVTATAAFLCAVAAGWGPAATRAR